ncbi:hypothetical protein GLOTRDRAFT_133160 [Gloeophyllum trabeum ATCC 11539]|uniref:Aspartic peptidase DDI1-type domain-containing protein n=1 Tax=Gloeophyllum trabeum (strain ATCC 11539 / FP-39264 / Madison 617) TaxID=670483 RepID=S7PU01_GLOTA|nr:uncharacterized protein GLOTRDRAFT_133160 [Gloeophyllum trabeum ATCC 11539]EPQ51286.1 hypothetical protein GLOTRDRAFT_133160 [Gloeophyllum trabeum ATCC 11539]
MDDNQGEDVAETVQPEMEDEYEALEGDGLAEPLEEDEYDFYNQEYDGDQYDNDEPEPDDRVGLMHYDDDEANIADFILLDGGESPYEYLTAIRDLSDEEILSSGHNAWADHYPELSTQGVGSSTPDSDDKTAHTVFVGDDPSSNEYEMSVGPVPPLVSDLQRQIDDLEFENQLLRKSNEALGRENDQLTMDNRALLQKLGICNTLKDDILRLRAHIQEFESQDVPPYILAIEEVKTPTTSAITTPVDGDLVPVRSQLVLRDMPGNRPTRTNSEHQCMTGYIHINGIMAHALFDSGSMLDCISPDFACIANIMCFELNNPTSLQLGTVGSCSKVNYGAHLKLSIGGHSIDHYFDVANIDRYDIVIGTPFLRASHTIMNFKDNTLSVFGKIVPSPPKGEGQVHTNRIKSRKPAKADQSNKPE